MKRRLFVCALLAACGASESKPSASGADGGAGGPGTIVVAPPTPLDWEDLTEAAGLSGITSSCRAVSFADLDGDGAPELVVPDQGQVRIYRNDGDGHFALWATTPTPTLQPINCPLFIGDLDGDGRRDIAVGTASQGPGGTGIVVLFNNGEGAFATVSVNQPQADTTKNYAADALGLVQTPGQDAVLYLANTLDGAPANVDFSACMYDGNSVACPTTLAAPVSIAYRIPKGTRTLMPVDSAVGLATHGNTQGLAVADLDGDGADDLLVAVDFAPQVALRSAGTSYVDTSVVWGVDHFAHGMGVALGDVDEDGATDVVISTLGGFLHGRGRPGKPGFDLLGEASPFSMRRRAIWPWQVLLEDLDNDGHLDLLAVNEFASHNTDPVTWLQMIGGPADYVGAFATVLYQDSATAYREGEVTYGAMRPGFGRPNSAAVSDVDGDGRLEVAMLLRDPSSNMGLTSLVLGHVGTTTGHGLTVRLGARAGQGTRVSVTCGGRTQVRDLYGAEGMGAAARTDAHFGCGAATVYESLRVAPRGLPAVDLPGGKLDTVATVP